MLDFLWWVCAGLVAFAILAFLFFGKAGAGWVISFVIWVIAQATGWAIKIAIVCSNLVVRYGAKPAIRLLHQERPRFRRPEKPLTPQVAILRTIIVIVVGFAFWSAWTRGGSYNFSFSDLLSFVRADKAVAGEDLSAVPAIIESSGATVMYNMGPLAGQNFGGLLTSYTGVRGYVSPRESVNFCENLSGLWDYKKRESNNHVVNQTAAVLVPEYCLGQPTAMNIGQYRRTVSEVLDRTRNDLNWAQVAQIKRLNSRQLGVLRNIVNALDGNDFIAYALTELMPTEDGSLNVRVLDFLLRNAGREYVESLPAVYDNRTSFGPYQFTSYAWRADSQVVEGANRLNNAMRNPVPHGSVMMLRGDQHHQAALLFAMNNLATAIGQLKSRELTALERNWKSSHKDFVQFIATAHHAPAGAHSAFRRWLNNGARRDFSVSLAGRLIKYARKTRKNYDALQEF